MSEDQISTTAQIPTDWVTVGNFSAVPIVPSEIYNQLFDEVDKRLKNHVYLICTRPRLHVVKMIGAGRRRLRIAIGRSATQSMSRARYEFRPPRGLWGMAGVSLSNGHLAATVDDIIVRRNGTQILRQHLIDLARSDTEENYRTISTIVQKFFTLNVAYVGQSYGSDGSRTPIDRLKKGHEKLQKVLSETQEFDRNLDIYIILIDCHVKQRDLRFTLSGTNALEMAEKSVDFLANPAAGLDSHDLRVDAVEACLIRVFQPQHNIALRDFPLRDAPALLKRLQAAGTNTIGVQLDVQESAVAIKMPDGQAYNKISAYYNLESGKSVIGPSAILFGPDRDFYFSPGIASVPNIHGTGLGR